MKPIIFNTAMVQAILNGSKSQTRRVIKNTKEWSPLKDITCLRVSGINCGSIKSADGEGFAQKYLKKHCPYGQVGDRLWVRETLRHSNVGIPTRYAADDCPVFRDGETPSGWPFRTQALPSMFMPRWASRLTLEITEVRVERVQEISEADAKAEGCTNENLESYPTCATWMPPEWYELPPEKQWIDDWRPNSERMIRWHIRNNFIALWDSLNTKRGYGWDTNPWVWVISFKPLQGQGD